MDIYDVAHDWASRNDDNGSASAGNLYHVGGAIYSYGKHFMIAKHVQNDQGEHAVLFTKQIYSRTTAKHVNIVESASAHLNKIYVPDPSASKEELFANWHNTMMNLGLCFERAKRPQKYVLALQCVYEEVKKYTAFFGYEIPIEITEAAAITDFAQYHEHLQKEKKRLAVIEANKKKQELRKHKENINRWRLFKTDYLRTIDGYDYLRKNKDTNCIETSQHVKIPLDTGRQFYQTILHFLTKSGCTNRPDKLVGKYEVLEINSKFIRVGCHQISLKEIKSFAKKQGW